jgi:hypothetical protein
MTTTHNHELNLEIDLNIQSLSIIPNPIKWIHLDKIDIKNQRIYIKIRRCIELGNAHLAFNLLKFNIQRPGFDALFDNNWVIDQLVNGKCHFACKDKQIWDFYFDKVFDDSMKQKYQEARNKCQI